MFEKEVMISGLKKQDDTLKKLIEELEEKPQSYDQDRDYCHETLKRIESALKKIRRMYGCTADNTRGCSYNNILLRSW